MTRTKCNLLAILFLASAAVASCAVKAETKWKPAEDPEYLSAVLEMCSTKADNSKAVMRLRQEGYGINRVINGLDREIMTTEFVQRIKEAWQEPLYHHPDTQQQAIIEYESKTLTKCLEENLPKD